MTSFAGLVYQKFEQKKKQAHVDSESQTDLDPISNQTGRCSTYCWGSS